MNKYRRIFLLVVFCLLTISPARAGDQWDNALNFLDKRFPPVYDQLGTVSEMNGDRVVFTLPGDKIPPARGQELLVTSNDDHPIYLQEPSTLIKVVSVFGNKVIAEKVMTVGKALRLQDNIVIPASPTIYLYTNVRLKDSFTPYQQLLKGLLTRNLEVVELTDPEISDSPARYGLLVRLEQSEDSLVCKIQSIYSKDTLYSMSAPASPNTPLVREAGRGIQLAAAKKAPLVFPPAGQPVYQASPGTYPPALYGQQKPALPFHARTLSPSEQEFYKLSGKDYKRMVIADLDADQVNEVCLLNEHGVFIFHFNNGHLDPVEQFNFSEEKIIPLHLHSIDLDDEGGSELLVTLTTEINFADSTDNRLCSMVLTWKNGHLLTMATNLPYYLRVIEDRAGQPVALGQTQEPYDQYDGPIFRLVYDYHSSTVKRGELYGPAAEIYSLYQFNFDPANKDQIYIIEPSNEVYGYYVPEEKVYAISPRKYGEYREVAYPKKLQKAEYNSGGFDKQTHRMLFTPRRFVLETKYDNQCFLINKERRSVAAVVGDSINRVLDRNTGGEDSIIGLTWRNNQIAETWTSADVAKDIIDFYFTRDKGYVLTRDTRGEFSVEAIR